MVWLKLSDDFALQLSRKRISDAAFRTHIEALSWTMSRESGGAIDAIDIRRFADSEQAQDAVRELLEKGIWCEEKREEDGAERHYFRLMMGMEDQLTPEQIATTRAANALRQRQLRERNRLKAEEKIAAANKDLSDSDLPPPK